jgi:repressor LexA
MMNDNRPTKKQRELLTYIETFIKETGYGPSYREVMRALDYKSVSTVATHVDGLIVRGFLRKRDHSARSLEVVTSGDAQGSAENPHLAWLKQEIARRRKGDDRKMQAEADILESALKLLDSTPN